MSVFHVFYLASDNRRNFQELKQLIIDTTPKASSSIANGKTQISEDTDSILNIWCEYFSLRVKNEGQPVKFRSEDYGSDFQYQFWFDANTSNINWFEELISFIGKIMQNCDNDCVLESNGETPLIMRKNKITMIDDRKLNDKQILIFNKMGLEYQKEPFESV